MLCNPYKDIGKQELANFIFNRMQYELVSQTVANCPHLKMPNREDFVCPLAIATIQRNAI